MPQVRRLLRGSRASSTAQRKVTPDGAAVMIDLGCGKGDFTLLLASALGAGVALLGVDTNPSAISFARARAEAAGLTNAHFRVADAAALRSPPGRVTGVCGECGAADGGMIAPWWSRWHVGDGASLLVALHACGGLSDVALSLAAACGASCLIATCCFGKHRELCPASTWRSDLREADKDVLCRMADCVEPTVAAEARTVVSNLRIDRLRAEMRPQARVADAAVRTFDPSYSRQNFVLAVECEEVASCVGP